MDGPRRVRRVTPAGGESTVGRCPGVGGGGARWGDHGDGAAVEARESPPRLGECHLPHPSSPNNQLLRPSAAPSPNEAYGPPSLTQLRLWRAGLASAPLHDARPRPQSTERKGGAPKSLLKETEDSG